MLIWKGLTEVKQCLPKVPSLWLSGPSQLKYVLLCFPCPVVLWAAVSLAKYIVNHCFLRLPV